MSRKDGKDKLGVTNIYLHDTTNIIDTAAKLSGMTRSAYIRDRIVEIAARDIDAALAFTAEGGALSPVAGDDNE